MWQPVMYERLEIQKPESKSFPVCYVREKIRTPDTLVRSQVLYPAELHTHIIVRIERSISYNSFWHLSRDLKKNFKIVSKVKKIFRK